MHRHRYGGSGPHHVSDVIPAALERLRAATQPTSHAPDRPRESRVDRYIRATRFALTHIVPLYRAAGLPITDVGVATVVGQLLAPAHSTSNRGPTPHGAPAD